MLNIKEPKYKFLINKGEKAGTNFNNDPNALLNILILWMIFYQILKIIIKKRRKVLIVFDDIISQVMSDKNAQKVLKDLFIRCRKLNISLCFLTQSFFSTKR